MRLKSIYVNMLTKKNSSKRKRGRPATGSGEVIGLRLQPDLEKTLERWMKDQDELTLTKQEAIRRLLKRALDADVNLQGDRGSDA